MTKDFINKLIELLNEVDWSNQEKIGFIGRKEGIAAEAIVQILND